MERKRGQGEGEVKKVDFIWTVLHEFLFSGSLQLSVFLFSLGNRE